MANQRISDLTKITKENITDPAAILALGADIQAATPGTSFSVGADDLSFLARTDLRTKTSHGLTTNDIGKPLVAFSVCDDLNSTRPDGLLVQVIDANTVRVATLGGTVDNVPTSLLLTGDAYDPESNGTDLYWDNSIGFYTPNKPADTAIGPCLRILSVETGTCTAYLASESLSDSGGGTTNLGWDAASSTVTSDTGTNASLTAVDNTNPGLMTPTQLGTLDDAVASGDVTMSQFATGSQLFLSITSGGITGGGLTMESATTSEAGLLSSADKTKLDGISGGEDLDGPIELVEGSGSAATDHTNLSAAVTALNASATGGTLWIKGTVIIGDTRRYQFTKPVSVKGVPGTNATLECQGEASSGYLSWNYAYNGVNDARNNGTAFSTQPSPGDGQIFVPAGSIAAGDWFMCVSDDLITEGATVQAGYDYAGLEIHQAKEVRDSSGGVDMIVFDDFLVENYTTNAKFKVMTNILSGIEVSGLNFIWTGSEGAGDGSTSGPLGLFLDFRACTNVTVKDCHWLNEAPNEASFFYCGNCIVTDCVFESARAYDNGDGYAVVIGPVNGFIFSDCVAYGWRHVFTTTAQSPTGMSVRYGTTHNVLLTNIVAKGNGSDKNVQSTNQSSLAPFDTHEMGYGIVFDSCTVNNPYDSRDFDITVRNPNRGFQTRSRNTVFQNCVVNSAGSSEGFLVLGGNCKIINCTVNGGWKAVETEDLGAITLKPIRNLVVNGLTFTPGTNTNCIMANLETGVDTVISHCTMNGTTGAPGGYGVLVSGSGTTATVTHCNFVNLQHEAIGIGSTTAVVRVSHCDFDNCGTTADKASVLFEHDGFLQIFNCTIDAEGNDYAFGGTTFGTINLKARGNTITGYSAKSGTTSVNGIDNTNSNLAALDADINGKNWTD